MRRRTLVLAFIALIAACGKRGQTRPQPLAAGSVALAREAGAQVLLVAVPRPTLAAALSAGLSDHPLFATLARELELPLHAGGWASGLAHSLRATGLLR